MIRRVRGRGVLSLLAVLALAVVSLTTTGTRPARADLQNPRQNFLRGSVAGLFLHWGERTSPAHTSCSSWENDVTNGGWTPDYWVNEGKKLHAQADQFWKAQRVARPERWIAAMMPGCAP